MGLLYYRHLHARNQQSATRRGFSRQRNYHVSGNGRKWPGNGRNLFGDAGAAEWSIDLFHGRHYRSIRHRNNHHPDMQCGIYAEVRKLFHIIYMCRNIVTFFGVLKIFCAFEIFGVFKKCMEFLRI